MIFTLDIYEWIVNFLFLGLAVAIWILPLSLCFCCLVYCLNKYTNI